MRFRLTIAALIAASSLVIVSALPALAHSGHGVTDGFSSGLSHPFSGWDHVVAMVAVGLWGAALGGPSIWLLPVVFASVMAFGGMLGVLGVQIPFVEAGIASSAIVLGVCVAMALRPASWMAVVLVGGFAVFHGHAHGTELPRDASALAYAAGFVVATGLLHAGGIGLGLLARWPTGTVAVRAAGVLIAAAGVAFLGAKLA